MYALQDQQQRRLEESTSTHAAELWCVSSPARLAPLGAQSASCLQQQGILQEFTAGITSLCTYLRLAFVLLDVLRLPLPPILSSGERLADPAPQI